MDYQRMKRRQAPNYSPFTYIPPPSADDTCVHHRESCRESGADPPQISGGE
jgi:hypothetical protein